MSAKKYKNKTYACATVPVLEMTKAEYDALPDAKKMDGTVYMITDDDGGWEAERSTYDNTTSGLTATNVQSALDELTTRSKKTNYYIKRSVALSTEWNSIAFDVDSSLNLKTCAFIVSCISGPSGRLSLPIVSYNNTNHTVTASIYNFDGAGSGFYFLLEVIEY